MLFRRQQAPNQPAPKKLDVYGGMIDQILKEQMNIDPAQARFTTDQGYGWTFRRGSAVLEVYVSEQEGRGYFQVLSPIVHLPTTGLLPLYRRLLELNLQLTNTTLGVSSDVVYVFSERSLDGLDAIEADYIIAMVAGYADDLDNQLVNEFGGRLYAQA
ncbi:MAG: YbjN domain-containing protein [Armatimonadetes bacterium]|nr:YbjN domain-containing protein [Anaerolineae bacterium]